MTEEETQTNTLPKEKKKGSINVGHPLEDFLKNAKPVNLKKRKFLRM